MTDSRLLAQSREVTQSKVSRRSILKSAALGSAAVLAAPYVRGAYAAGSLSLGFWDHWVPGANNALIKLCNEWGAKTKSMCTSTSSPRSATRTCSPRAPKRRPAPVTIRVAPRLADPRCIATCWSRGRHRQCADQGLRSDQPGRRISRPARQGLVRHSHHGRQPGEAAGLAHRSLQAILRHRSDQNLPGPRSAARSGSSPAGTTIFTSRPPSKLFKPAIRSVWRWPRPATRSMRPAPYSVHSFMMNKDNVTINADTVQDALESFAN